MHIAFKFGLPGLPDRCVLMCWGGGLFHLVLADCNDFFDSEDLIRQFEPNWEKSRGNGITLCFKQGSASQVDELYKTILQAGFESIKPPWDAFWGQRYACVADPDGNQIDLFAPL